MRLFRIQRESNSRGSSSRAGFSLLEVVVAVSMIMLLVYIILPPLRGFWQHRMIDAQTENVLTLISQARLDTISSKDDDAFGIHLESDRVTYYIGPAYDAATTSTTTVFLHPSVEIASIALQGGGSDILFKKWTGATDQYGSFILRLKNTPGETPATISVLGTGIFSVQ